MVDEDTVDDSVSISTGTSASFTGPTSKPAKLVTKTGKEVTRFMDPNSIMSMVK